MAVTAKMAFESGKRAGIQEGRQQVRVEVLSWLQHEYIDSPDRPDRDSPEAAAILSLARRLSESIQVLKPNETLTNAD
jgi:hypothetical protein